MRNSGNLKLKLLLSVLLVIGVVAVLELTNTTHFFHKSAVVRAPAKPINQLPKQPVAQNGQKTSTTNTDIQGGSEVDKNGQPVNSTPTDPSKWSTSASGKVTVKLPVANGKFASGSTITGTATLDTVQYRLVDNQVGVISQGAIKVVNGNFTAAITFKSYATSGRLDVFNNDADGREINEVQVPLSF